MKQSSLSLLTKRLRLFAPMAGYMQSVTRLKQPSIAPDKVESKQADEMALAARSMFALKRLEKDVLIYRSLGDFEANGKLARVSYQAFRNDLNEVSSEVEGMLSRLPQSKLKTELGNALASYRDGGFWWQQIDKPRVAIVKASAASPSSSEVVLKSSVPYTVTIHWRQANRSLKRAAQLMKTKPPTGWPVRIEPTQAAFAPSASAR